VSSFGFSGTNAHAVLEEYPQPVLDRSLPERPLHVLALSAKDPAALRDLVVLMQERLAISDKTELPNICFTTNAGRSHHTHRLALHGDTPEALIAGLKAFMKSGEHSTIASGSVQGISLSPLAFLCTGQGSQYPRMGRTLFETSPTFRKTIEQCDAFLGPLLGRSVMDMDDCPSGDERSALIHQTAYTQPALFSLEYALARLWQSWGIEPAYVTGHSAGAYVAACLAGVFSLEDALRLVAIRGRLSQDLPHEGAMAGIDADEASVAAMMAGYEGHVAIAAVNAPDSTVISGERERVEEVLRHCEISGWKTRRLRVSHAFHSALVEPMLDAFWDALSKVTFHTPAVPMVTDTTGLLLGPGEVPGADYWIEHLRRPVRFKSVMETLDALGVRTYVEVGPDPVLLSLGARSVPADGRFWLPSLRRGWDDWEQLLQSLRELYVRGFSINWNGFEMGYLRRLVSLPGYPFRKGRYWFTSAGSALHRDGASVPPWEEAISEARRQSGSARVELNIREYPRRWGVLEEWSVGLIVETLRSLGVFAVPNSWITPDGILEQGRILPIHRTLIVRWIDRLVHKELVLREGEKYSVGEPLPNQDLQHLWGAVEEVLAENQPLLAYLRSCKDKLVAVLRGSLSPLETLFPNGSFDLAEALYERSSTSAYVNDIAAVVVRALTRSYGKESDRHILEIGGGTGGTTASLLPVLPSEGVTYDFTDVSDLFLARARQRFAGWPHLRTAVFDIELESEKQGFQTHFYDLIVGANVVHAVRDLNRTLANLRSLLVPEGVLLLVESTMDHAWFDVSTGLIEGWQRFEDSHRTESPLLSSDRWKEILLENGFVEAHAFPEHRSIGDELGLHVVIARAGGRALPPRLAADVEVSSSDASDASGSSGKKGEGGGADQVFLEGLSASLSGERVDLMMTFVRDRVMRILRLDDGHAPGRDARLMDLGMDSLMAIQLRNSLRAGLAIEGTLPATLIFDYPTVREISRYLLSVLFPEARSVQEPRHLTPRGPGDIESLTETEVEDLLMKRLAQQRKSNG
jgi:malonyl CoA-acyl carrier protein transacylase/SAM-dependent methyltransferase